MNELSKIKYSTPEHQIESLKEKGLIFYDESLAMDILENCGYYNIINSYKQPYLYEKEGQKLYKPNVSFEQIYSMYIFDHNLRNSIMAAMLDIEENLKAILAEVIAKNFGTDINEYLKFNHYRDRKFQNPKNKEQFGLDAILASLQKTSKSNKEPIKYYREQHHTIPPWILFKSIYFSTLINFIQLLKSTEKEEVIGKIYRNRPFDASLSETKRLFTDTCSICLDFRNTAAHGGRIYNYNSSNAHRIKENTDFFKRYPEYVRVANYERFQLLQELLSYFSFQNPNHILQGTMSEELNRHLKMFPQDKEILENTLSLVLVKRRIGWYKEGGNILHTNPNCSGLKNPSQLIYDKLDRNKYIPCQKCMQETL